eukprot:12659497-Alexandrium_andersonii.AAC.1
MEPGSVTASWHCSHRAQPSAREAGQPSQPAREPGASRPQISQMEAAAPLRARASSTDAKILHMAPCARGRSACST